MLFALVVDIAIGQTLLVFKFNELFNNDVKSLTA